MLKRVFAAAAAFVLLGALGTADAQSRRRERVEPLPANSRVLGTV